MMTRTFFFSLIICLGSAESVVHFHPERHFHPSGHGTEAAAEAHFDPVAGLAPYHDPAGRAPRRRLQDGPPEETYSWGAAKQYSADYDADGSHSIGPKSVLVIRYRRVGATAAQHDEPEDLDTVISDEDLNEIIDAGDDFIRENSYGKTWLANITVVPLVVNITGGHFFEITDALRENAYEQGYDFTQYDIDTAWVRSGAGEGMGGSAIPGGRTQSFMYDGGVTGFKKIFSHEFMHNFGTGHAWTGGSEYGDDSDITGAGSGPRSHVSAATKHRFHWIEDQHVVDLSPASLPVGERRAVTLRAFDVADAPSTLGAEEYLAVRLATRWMGAPCPKGGVAWCPDWTAAYNDRNAWVDHSTDLEKSDHWIYLSYRANDESGDGVRGVSIHVAKYKPSGWMAATSFIDVRPNTVTQSDAFLLPGETFVFDSESERSIVITAVTVDAESHNLRLEVEYSDGAAATRAYEKAHAAHLCEHTLSCGKEIELVGGSASNEGDAVVMVKVGEAHKTEALVGACALSLQGGVDIFAYTEFPAAQALHGASLEIGAASRISDFCADAAYPIGFTIPPEATGVWWLDGASFLLLNNDVLVYDGTTGAAGRAVPSTEYSELGGSTAYPHYLAKLHSGGTTHLMLVHCTLWYCQDDGYSGLNGGGEHKGWMWVVSYGAE